MRFSVTSNPRLVPVVFQGLILVSSTLFFYEVLVQQLEDWSFFMFECYILANSEFEWHKSTKIMEALLGEEFSLRNVRYTCMCRPTEFLAFSHTTRQRMTMR